VERTFADDLRLGGNVGMLVAIGFGIALVAAVLWIASRG